LAVRQIFITTTIIINESGSSFLESIGEKDQSSIGRRAETAFLFQRLSVLVQRFNSVLLHDSFVRDLSGVVATPISFLSFFPKIPRDP